ncbi:MAG: carbohydrate ABC transporter permease [Gemmatimonadaceae bacterium]
MRSGSGARRLLGYAMAVSLALVATAPFVVMVATSLMDEFEVFNYPPPLLPSNPRWANYPEALTAMPFDLFFRNSAILAVFTVAGQVTSGAMGGYAFARYRFAGRNALFALFLGSLMVPTIVMLIPRFLLVNAMGGVDTLAGLVSAELVAVWSVFLMRQFFLTLPREMEDAARVDGASEWTIFWKVALPLARPALATVALFAFIDAWKNFLWPLIITRSVENRVVEVGIANFHGFYYANWPFQMAAAVTAVVPVLIVFFVAQRYFIRGIQLTGLR